MRSSPAAFTLLEVLVVLALTAILGAMTVMMLRTDKRSARGLSDVIHRIGRADATVRGTARRLGREEIIGFDLSSGKVTRREAGEGAAANEVGIYEVRSPYRIERLIVEGTAGSVPNDVTSGRALIRCSGAGYSPTYAIRISSPGGNVQSDLQSWIVVTGMTGEAVEVSDNASVMDIFRSDPGHSKSGREAIEVGNDPH